jgi:NitT/TauT family transport system permease protein
MIKRVSMAPWPLLAVVALPMSPVTAGDIRPMWWDLPTPAAALVVGIVAAMAGRFVKAPLVEGILALLSLLCLGAVPLLLMGDGYSLASGAGPVWMIVLAAAGMTWHAMAVFAALDDHPTLRRLVVPTLFGVALLYLWEVGVRGFEVPAVLLPPPNAVASALASHGETLWADFKQTVLQAVIRGYVMGCLAGFALAIIADRVPFLARGLLPLANLASAVPIVGIAPVMVMWFGFDWQSKAAVVVVMTFFPMLVNTLAGLQSAEKIQLDLMRSYGAGYWGTLVHLRLPAALPFLFNGLKINSTLALIGAIVAEFFGTPIVGMGFRISSEVARMNVDVVWATIAVAALVGSGAYGLLSLAERRVTFWHASFRTK